MIRLILSLIALVGVSGCLGSAPPVPRDHYYRILVPAPDAAASGRRLPGVLSIQLFEADGLLRERPLVFSATGRSHMMQQHDYHHWTDPPTRMLQGQLAGYLRKSGLAETVVTPDLRVRPDFLINGRIKRLEHVLGGGSPRVFAELELALIRRADDNLILLDTYAAEEPSRGAGIEASISALNRAVAKIFARFLADARQIELAVKPNPR